MAIRFFYLLTERSFFPEDHLYSQRLAKFPCCCSSLVRLPAVNSVALFIVCTIFLFPFNRLLLLPNPNLITKFFRPWLIKWLVSHTKSPAAAAENNKKKRSIQILPSSKYKKLFLTWCTFTRIPLPYSTQVWSLSPSKPHCPDPDSLHGFMSIKS